MTTDMPGSDWLRENANEALLRATVNAVTEQIDILHTRAAHYARGADEVTQTEPLRWAGYRGQAMAYEAAATMIAEALQAKAPAEDRAAREAGTVTRAPHGGVRPQGWTCL